MTLKEILRHIREVHRHFTTPVRCGINDCPSITTTYKSLRQHLYKKHRSDFVVLPPADCDLTMSCDLAGDVVDIATSVTEAPFIDNAVSRGDTTRETASEHTEHCSHSDNTFASAHVLEMGRFILKIRDGKGLTQVVTDSIVRDMQSVVECSCENVEKQLISKLNSFNKLSVGEMEEVKEIFLSAKASIKCEELESKHKQDIFIEDNFNYVVSA